MDPERERIKADLRGLIQGDVRCDDIFVQLYAGDASIFEIRPLGVVRPRGTSDVVACLQYAAANEIPVHARGAGTGLAGGAVGPGLVLDFSHAMRRIISLGEDSVRVQAGVTLAHLNRELKSRGRIFGPDPTNANVTTLGGMLAVDASGSHWPRYGSARQWIERLQVVLASGDVLELGREKLEVASGERPAALQHIVHGTAAALAGKEALIAAAYPKTAVNSCGYHLTDVLRDGHVDFRKLLAGSEGTLALVTEATLRTDVPLPQRGAALLLFERLEHAAEAGVRISESGPSACELYDRRLVAIARETDVQYDLLIPPQTGALLLVEYDGESPAEVREKLDALVARVVQQQRLAFDARLATDRDQLDLFWQLAHRVVPTWYRLEGSTRPVPCVEDIAVPPQRLPEFLTRLLYVLKRHQVTASMFAHTVQGQLHLRPFLNLSDPQQVATMRQLAVDLYHEVLEIGGVVSGKHGDGLSRTWFVHEQYGELYDTFREIKRCFDPLEILNPGKVVGADDPHALTQHLRPVTLSADWAARDDAGGESPIGAAAPAGDPDAVEPTRAPVVELQMMWRLEDALHQTRSCNGCGHCRGQEPLERMCPVFRAAPSEEASPRAKADLMRALFTGQLAPGAFAQEELKQVADLCVHCHQCRFECPARVDIPRLMAECKAQYVATKGLSLSDATMTRLDRLSALASRISPIYNWAIRNRPLRWLMERLLGIAQGRKLPRVAARSFLRRARRRRMTRPVRRSGRKVLLFVDVYANWYDVQLADALVAILKHNHVSVFVHPRQRQSGISMIALGALDRAKRVATHNIALLADAVRQGYQIVTPEPAAALCLTHEYLHLVDDRADALLVAEHTSEACHYLWKMHQAGNLELDLKPVHAALGYHQPCHLKALGVGTPGENLLRLIPGLAVKHLERGCSGMAGTYGLKRENYRSSLRAGWGLISSLRNPAIQAGTTECSACKMQMEQGTTKPTIHPLKILALSYGLMTEVAPLLTTPGENLVVT